tara:strand:- start:950 stop:1144 length:195 start_codon:yes stop_codon:yes gene_type:complete
MNLVDLEISVNSLHILQQSGIWELQDIIEGMDTDPAIVSLALAKIKKDDFIEITEAIKKNQENV